MSFVLETCSVLVHYMQNKALDNVQRYFLLRFDQRQVRIREVYALICSSGLVFLHLQSFCYNHGTFKLKPRCGLGPSPMKTKEVVYGLITHDSICPLGKKKRNCAESFSDIVISYHKF